VAAGPTESVTVSSATGRPVGTARTGCPRAAVRRSRLRHRLRSANTSRR
jgi:hypothetical protein